MSLRLVNDHLKHPAHTPEARLKQLKEGIIPDFGRGSCGGTSRLPQGKCWAPHTGERQKLRVLRQTWKRFEKICARDGHYKATRERLLDSVCDDPTPEYAAMNICLGALIASEEKQELARRFPAPAGVTPPGIEWVDALNAALNQFEENADIDAPPPERLS